MSKLIDLTGLPFDRLRVIARGPNTADRGVAQWWCECECGNITLVNGQSLRRRLTHSCGCWNSELTTNRNMTHGLSKTREYHIWRSIHRRCYDPVTKAFPYYGGRGITICDRWRSSFMNFYTDMGPSPTPKHSLERVDNDGPYSPDNVIWALPAIQARNKRNNTYWTHNGITQCIADWAHTTGISDSVLCQRHYKLGWSIEKTLTTPIRKPRHAG